MLMKINRYREIFGILTRYGLAGWISRLNLDFVKDIFEQQAGEGLTQFSHEKRVRMAITELGPAFIKLGQILSTRADLVGYELAEELKSLQSNVPADLQEEVRRTIESELGRQVEELFAGFDFRPLGSASIGQVHLATLKTGEQVVVKVQHHGIEEKIRLDLEILLDLADLVEKYVEESRNYRPLQTCEEFKRMLLHELDFRCEKRNLKQFAANFAKDPDIHIPEVFDALSTGKVLTMEKIVGIPISDRLRLEQKGYDIPRLTMVGATLFLRMIFDHGFYHADPHPGNIFVMEGPKLGLIDCGMIGRLDEELREDIEDLLLCVARRNSKKLIAIITRIGSVPRDLDRAALQHEFTDFVEFYSALPIKEIQLSKTLDEITSIVRRYKIVLPTSIALLIKVLVMLEGTSRSLDPDFDLVTLIRPFQNKMLLRRLSPMRQKRLLESFYQDLERVMHVIPLGLADVIQNLQENKFSIRIESDRMENGVNRLVFGLITSSLFLGSSMLMAFKTPPVLWGVSALGLVGYIISLAFGLKLLWEIYVYGNRGHRR